MENLPQLVMFLDDLVALPPIVLPHGYTVRRYREGDGAHWNKIITESFKSDYDYDKHMKTDAEYRDSRVWFVCFDDKPVATASAWYRSGWDDDTGYLHMVGILPEHAGKGLGLQVSLAALYEMKLEGRKRAVLNTDDFRLPAIKTYLKLGFKPMMTHESHPDRWEKLISLSY